MRTLLVSICCLSLACFAGAAQHDQDQDNNGQPKNKKEKGQSVQSSQAVIAPSPHTGGKAKLHAQGLNGPIGPVASPIPSVGGKVKYHTEENVSGAGTNRTLKYGDGKVTGQTETNVSGNANLNTKLGKNKFSSQTNMTGGGVKFQKKHFNLANNPNPKYQAVKFNQSYKIAGANKWKGSKYQVFVNYQPQWHDQYWWTSHHNHITIVFGAPYYWDAGYWYPCWGYSPSAEYYFDGPIYASNPEMDPGQVVANVQAALQEQGYYQGDIDGILGPQTRAALADYQVAQGLEPTGAIDEPTLETLNMA
jgi:hypothetical protein